MKKELKAHLFVCTNTKKNGECCGPKGAAEMRDRLKKICHDKGIAGDVRINASGCLGHCEAGITAVLYPQGKWFTNLSNKDDAKLLAAVEEALSS